MDTTTMGTKPRGTPHTISVTSIKNDIILHDIWHQRLGHCSVQVLRRKQTLSQGMPRFHHGTLPPFIACCACDIAKLRKAPKGPSIADPPGLANGQIFQMDIGFIRGPENLPDVIDHHHQPQQTVQESRHGYVCYLLIVDRRSRYSWIFPMKSKAIKLDLLRLFLQTHGNKDSTLTKYIRTNGEGSLAESNDFRALLASFGYQYQRTATDASSQNGMARRPHQTLANMVRCMLYSSSMLTKFWAEAALYSVYIINLCIIEESKRSHTPCGQETVQILNISECLDPN